MQKLRELDPAEIEKLRYVLRAETRQYQIGYFACAGGAIAMAGLALYELFGFGSQGTEVLQVLLAMLALLMAGIAYMFRSRARSFEFQFGPVYERSGAFSRRVTGSTRYLYSVYYIDEDRIYIPQIWNTEQRFNDGSPVTIHFTEVTNVSDGAVTDRRKFVVEIPGFKTLKEQGWVK